MEYSIPLESVTDWRRTRRGTELTVDQEQVRLDFVKDDILRGASGSALHNKLYKR